MKEDQSADGRAVDLGDIMPKLTLNIICGKSHRYYVVLAAAARGKSWKSIRWKCIAVLQKRAIYKIYTEKFVYKLINKA